MHITYNIDKGAHVWGTDEWQETCVHGIEN